MSLGLLKKSLELSESDFKTNSDGKSSSVKVVKKEAKVKTTRGISDVKRKNLNTIEKVKKKLEKEKKKKELNIERLKLLRKQKVKGELAKKILEYTGKTYCKKEEKKEEKSVFTEEDFLRFEREYQPDE